MRLDSPRPPECYLIGNCYSERQHPLRHMVERDEAASRSPLGQQIKIRRGAVINDYLVSIGDRNHRLTISDVKRCQVETADSRAGDPGDLAVNLPPAPRNSLTSHVRLERQGGVGRLAR